MIQLPDGCRRVWASPGGDPSLAFEINSQLRPAHASC
jgi:hypothetical protein